MVTFRPQCGESSGSGGNNSGISGKSSGISSGRRNSGRCEDREIMIRDDNIGATLICFFCLCHGVAEIFIKE